jgi:hypothetical protein
MATVRLEGLGQLKNRMTSSGIEPATFWLAAQSLNQLRYQGNLNEYKYQLPHIRDCQSVSPRMTTREALNGFSRNLILESCTKFCQHIQILDETRQQ